MNIELNLKITIHDFQEDRLKIPYYNNDVIEVTINGIKKMMKITKMDRVSDGHTTVSNKFQLTEVIIERENASMKQILANFNDRFKNNVKQFDAYLAERIFEWYRRKNKRRRKFR